MAKDLGVGCHGNGWPHPDQSPPLLNAGYQATIVAGVKEGSINATDTECHGLMLPGLFVWLASENGNTTKPQREKIAAEIAVIVTIGLAT